MVADRYDYNVEHSNDGASDSYTHHDNDEADTAGDKVDWFTYSTSIYKYSATDDGNDAYIDIIDDAAARYATINADAAATAADTIEEATAKRATIPAVLGTTHYDCST